MAKAQRPRFGSMGVWPRKRATRAYARVRSVAKNNVAKPLVFAGYKVGMTQVVVAGDSKAKRATSDISQAVTIIECPPMKIAGVRMYIKEGTAHIVSKQINFKTEKELSLKTKVSKTKVSNASDLEKLNPNEFSRIMLLVYTQPKLTSIKKKPELFEVALGGSNTEKLDFIKTHIDKPITINDVFQQGHLVDIHSITRGKGFQGAVKRFGIGLKSHKSEKARRTPGSLGGWISQAHVMYRVAHAGQTGYHQRTQYNNLIMKIGDKPEEVNPKGGFLSYGLVKNPFVLIKGSVGGSSKRLITLTEPIRVKRQPKFKVESIKKILLESQQGR